MLESVVTSVETPVETTTINSKPLSPLESPSKEMIPHTSLYEMFSAEKSERVEKAFSMIWKYATNQAENKDLDSIKLEIIRLKNRLGSPHIGEPSYSKLERYVSAYYNLKKAQSELDEVSK